MSETTTETPARAASDQGETTTETAIEAPRGAVWTIDRDVVRDVVSLAAILAGLAGAIVCLAHWGWWAFGLGCSVLVLCLGVAGALRRGGPAAEPTREVIVVPAGAIDPHRAAP